MRFPPVLAAVLILTTTEIASAKVPAGFDEKVVASGLASPTSMAVAGDGRVFVCEQAGRLRVVKDGALLSRPFVSLTADSSGERGLLGVALDPDFAKSPFVYVYYTATSPTIHNRVSRFRASGDVASGSEDVLLELPTLGSTHHNGGSLHFGGDGFLYVGVGENEVGARAQDAGDPRGKLLRIARDGSLPTDNPFSQNRAVWARGLRNPYSFAVQPGTGRILISDVGENAWEEVDEGVKGANYGWPTIEGPSSDSRFRPPLHAYNHDAGECAITGAAFYNPLTVQFPADYLGSFFFGDFCAGFIRRLQGNTVHDFITGLGAGSVVDIDVADDGSLYYLVHGSGRLMQVSHAAPPSGGSPGGGACPAVAAGAGFVNQTLPSTSDAFSVGFDAVPGAAPMDGVIGLSHGPQTLHEQFLALVRFSDQGKIEARDGGAYSAASVIPYAAGAHYHFRLDVDGAHQTYSAFVSPPGQAELTIGRDLAYRPTAASVGRVDTLGAWVKPGLTADLQVCGVTVTSPGLCQVTPSTGLFADQPFAAQRGTFTASFDATPSAAPTDTVIGLASGAAALHDDFAALFRFGRSGVIEARDGGSYRAVDSVAYQAGVAVHFRWVVDVAGRRHSLFATVPGQPERTIASSFAFRDSATAATVLDHWGAWVNATTPGQVQVCGFGVSGSTPPPPPPSNPPPSSGGKTIKNVYITWYGFNDNSCQVESQHSCNNIAFPKSDGFPVPHNAATEGKGTFDDPVTFATAASDGGGSAEFAPGTIIYVPLVRKYFVMEDSCFECGQEWSAHRTYHVDLWMGPSDHPSSDGTLTSCEEKLTVGSANHGTAEIVADPPRDLPVDVSPLYSNNRCTAHSYP